MANIDEVYGALSEIFVTRTSAEWLDLLEKADVPVMPMYDFKGVLQDPHLKATSFFRLEEHPSEGTIRTMAVPAKWSRSPADPARHAPRSGEHSEEVLREAGFTEIEINDLLDRGIARTCGDVASV